MHPVAIFPHAITSVRQHGATVVPWAESSLERVGAPVGPAATFGTEEVARRGAALRALLLRRQLQFEADPSSGVIVVLGCLHAAPPYTAHSVRCENEIVLGSFLRLLGELESDLARNLEPV